MSDKLLKAQKRAFLIAFAGIGIIADACKAAGVTRADLKRWKKDDPQFLTAYLEAEEDAADNLEKEAHRRAVKGWHEPVLYKGEMTYVRDPHTGEFELDDELNLIPVTVLKKSDRMLERMLEARHVKYARKGPGTGTGVDSNAEAPPTKIIVRFTKPPNWDEGVEWGEDGKPVLH